MFNSKKNALTPPTIATKLLIWCLPKDTVEFILGDLEEEFYLRAKHNVIAAKYWFWQQSISSSSIYLKQKTPSSEFLTKFTMLFSFFIFIVIFQLITWLHYSDSLTNFSPNFWDSLVSGHIHMALFESAFWQQSIGTWQQINGWSFLIDESAIVLTLFSTCLFILFNRRRKLLAHQILLFGCGAMFIPYIFGIGYVNVFDLPAPMVGPILSIMLLNVFYLLLPIAYLVLRKVKIQNNNPDF